MDNSSNESFRLVETIREHWAEIMLHALKENGHVYLNSDDYYCLKGEIMQILTGKIKI